jgi:hypothetical protein
MRTTMSLYAVRPADLYPAMFLCVPLASCPLGAPLLYITSCVLVAALRALAIAPL